MNIKIKSERVMHAVSVAPNMHDCSIPQCYLLAGAEQEARLALGAMPLASFHEIENIHDDEHQVHRFH